MSFLKKNFVDGQQEKKLMSQVAIFLIILSFWIIIFSTSDLLFSGFHFVDDHDIVMIHYDLKNLSNIEVITKFIAANQGRFRPMYYVHRVLQTQIFGVNWAAWFSFNAILASITTFFLFLFGGVIQLSIRNAVLLTALTVLGNQASAWWRLGTAETYGMLYLSAALFFAAFASKATRFRSLWNCIFIVLIVLASLSKESFILFIPAACLIKIWAYSKLNRVSLQISLSKNAVTSIVLLAVCVVETLYIKYVVGVGGTGYAGIDSSSFDPQRIWLVSKILAERGFLPVSVLAMTTALVCAYFKRKSHRFPLNNLAEVLIIFFAATLPQILLYTKSGLDFFYLFPALIGYSFLTVQILALLDGYSKYLSQFFVFVLIFFIAQNIIVTWTASSVFAKEGNSTRRLLDNVEQCAQQNQPVLVVANPRVHNELSFSIKRYLNYKSGIDNLFVSTYGTERTQFSSETFKDEEGSWQFIDPKVVEVWYDHRTLARIQDKGAIASIVIFPGLEKDFLQSSRGWFILKNYKRYYYSLDYMGGTITMYCKVN
jgi:hypothetical protein